MTGSHEARGSSPLSSTTKSMNAESRDFPDSAVLFCFPCDQCLPLNRMPWPRRLYYRHFNRLYQIIPVNPPIPFPPVPAVCQCAGDPRMPASVCSSSSKSLIRFSQEKGDMAVDRSDRLVSISPAFVMAKASLPHKSSMD